MNALVQETALFDLDGDDMTAPILEARALTPYGRHHGIGPGTFPAPYCGQVLYGSIESTGRRMWIYHACTQTEPHEHHRCDRCEETW